MSLAAGLLAALLAAGAAAAPAPAPAPQDDAAPAGPVLGANGLPLSSQRDYLDPAQRALPITCKDGDLERHPGKSLGDVFGADWPQAAAPADAAASAPPRTLESSKIIWPRGLEGRPGLVVVAVLVGADGKPLRAEPLCASVTGFDMAARRAAMGATYAPAQLDGQAVVAPLVRVVQFKPPRRNSTRRGGSTQD